MKTEQNPTGDRELEKFTSKKGGLFAWGIFGICLCLGGGAFAQDRAKSENILPNGSFETAGSSGGQSKPEGWSFYATSKVPLGEYIENDPSKAHSGSHAVMLASNKAKDPYITWTSEPAAVTPKATYLVSGWIKTSECLGNGAWLWIFGSDDQGGKMMTAGKISSNTPYFDGTQEWQEWSAEVQLAENIRWLRIACRLDGDGTAWFDDISVTLIK